MKPTKIVVLMLMGLALAMSQSAVADDAIHVTPTGDVGFGTNTPSEKIHVKDGNFLVEQTNPGTHAILKFATAGSSWEIKQNGDTGRLTFFSPGGGAITASFKFAPAAVENLFRVGVLAADTVDINGKLVINGTDVTPDYVFEPDYSLETIEEHADLMWQNKHLPSLPGATANEEHGVDVVRHQFGVLEELEKAHIYIEQLHLRLLSLENEQKELRNVVSHLLQKNNEADLYTSLE